MGFSTSGSLLVVFVALFVALGSFYTTTSNTTSEVTETTAEEFEQNNEVLDTQVNVTNATWNNNTEELVVTVNNTGTRTLAVNATDLLVNGQYVGGWEKNATIDSSDRNVWAADEQLRIADGRAVVDVGGTPERVVVVTGTGVTVQSDVEVVN